MTRFNKNKLYTKANTFDLNAEFDSQSKKIQVDSSSDTITKGKEAIRIERLELLEDKFVQSICKER